MVKKTNEGQENGLITATRQRTLGEQRAAGEPPLFSITTLPLRQMLPSPIKAGRWTGYREYIGPNGEMVLYQPTIDELIAENEAQAPAPVLPGGARDDAGGTRLDDHPHTVSPPPVDGAPAPQPAVTGQPQPPQADDDVDGELLRHREWLRRRFDQPKPQRPPAPDRTRSGTYQRLRDEVDATARRIAQIEQERYDSLMPDWLWDQLFGTELRMLLVHLRSMRWQVEEFEKAYAAGDDPVEALNRYNRQQWEIFLRALEQHIQLLGQALIGVEAVRAFQHALEEALKAAQQVRQRRANDWLRTRERARAKAEAEGGPGSPEPPPRPATSTQGRTGGLTRREWRRIRVRREVNNLPQPSAEWEEANRRYKQEFPAGEEEEAQFGQTFGTVTRSEDGKSITVTTHQMSPDGVVSGTTVETLPIDQAPENFGLSPGQTEPFTFTNEGGR